MASAKFAILKTHNMIPQRLVSSSSDTTVSDGSQDDMMVVNIDEMMTGMVACGKGLIDNVITR